MLAASQLILEIGGKLSPSFEAVLLQNSKLTVFRLGLHSERVYTILLTAISVELSVQMKSKWFGILVAGM
jgi:hypothetical protein